MKDIERYQNPYHDEKVHEACAIFGAMAKSGKTFSAEFAIRAMSNMRERGTGLGAGFAVYGLYPEMKDLYAAHVMYLDKAAIGSTEEFLSSRFQLVYKEELPTRKVKAFREPPTFKRYFLGLRNGQIEDESEEDYIVRQVMTINNELAGSYVFSLGRDMGVFKGLGYPEDIAEFFCLENYRGYIWTAHSRFPTNTPGWWGGAHPFSLLDLSVVHNGELSSYGINRRYLEQSGYNFSLKTDTEVVAYAFDLLVRRHHLPPEIAAMALAPPFWDEIDRREAEERSLLLALRQTYSSLLLNGPFAIIIARHGEMIGLTDRTRLRPLIVGRKGDMVFLSSEESAIRLVEPGLEEVFSPCGGEPVISRLGTREAVGGAINC